MPLVRRRRRAPPRLAWLAARASLAVALLASASPSTARADGPAPKATPEQQAQARDHYAHARELYQQGAYHEAIAELDSALVLDPNAPDLVFNLGVVHEKLGNIEAALKYFRHYQQMDLDAQARSRADAYIKRLEGARREVEKPPVQVVTPPPQPPPDRPPPPPAPVHGRMDAATIVAISVSGIGLGIGTAFGLRALSLKPKSGFVTGRDGSFSDLQNETERAHKDAIYSDIGFAVGLAAGVTAAYLYFARTRHPAPSVSQGAVPKSPPVDVSGAAVPGGGVLFLGGRF